MTREEQMMRAEAILKEYWGKKTAPPTNYERITSQSPYDMADWIAKILMYHGSFSRSDALECDPDCPLYKCCNDQPSDNIEDWLKAPAEVDA